MHEKSEWMIKYEGMKGLRFVGFRIFKGWMKNQGLEGVGFGGYRICRV